MRNYTGETAIFEAGRERIRGGLWLHKNSELAASMLAEALGGRAAARRWARDVIERLAAR